MGAVSDGEADSSFMLRRMERKTVTMVKSAANTQPRISVIVPVYNVEPYIDRCLQSILGQTYQNLEIVLVNDGSTDNSGAICERYARQDSRIRVYDKPYGGVSDARNYGVSHATGTYLTFVDSDDYIVPDYAEYLLKILTRSQAEMAVCQHVVWYGNKHFHTALSGEDVLPPKTCIERMLYHDVIDTSVWGKLYRRDLFDGISYPKGKLYEDIATTYKLILKCQKIAVGYEPKYHYVMNPDSIVNRSFHEGKFDLLEMTDNMASDVVKVYPDLARAALRRRVYARFSVLNQMLRSEAYPGRRNEIIRFILRHRKQVFMNKKTPARDRIAILLLSVDYRLYRWVWLAWKKQFLKM